MSDRMKWGGLLLVTLVAAWSCDYATDVELLEIEGTGVLRGSTYLDLNGTGAPDTGDQPLKNVSVVLTAPGSGEVLLDATTDTLGTFVLTAVPVGTYEVGLGPAVLGDSLTPLGPGGSVSLESADTISLSLGAAFPTLTFDEIRAAAPGRRVFALGVALNSRLASTDGTIHLLDTTAVSYLRTTNSSLPTGGVLVGDSLRLLGRTAVDNGQPVLDGGTPIVLQRGLSLPPPADASTGTAATADGGALDAALVRVRKASISDTSTAPNGDFHFWANDGSDSVEVVFKWFRGITSTGVRPDTIVGVNQLTGLLTPYDDGTGAVRWRILPRGGSEVVLEFKNVDIALTTAFDPATATTSDMVEIIVTAQNDAASTYTATSVSVTDTIPSALTFVSSTATSGSYSGTTHVWDIGNLAPGAADTLRISAQVTGGAGTATNRAWLDPLTLEVDSNSGNDSAAADLTIS